MSETKQTIRRRALSARRSLSPALRRWKDRRIENRLRRAVEEAVSPEGAICIYWSLPEEAGTHDLVEELLRQGRKVLMPCHSGECALKRVTHLAKDLLPGENRYILEPAGHCEKISPEEVDLFIVPGVAYDIRGSRIGFGGGYFDQVLVDKRPESGVLALAYECQMFRKVPSDPAYDQPVDRVLTEEREYRYFRSRMEVSDLEAMKHFAERLARVCGKRLRLGLSGTLGVGKTTFIQFLARSLGVKGEVSSPSFVLINEYQGQVPVRHIDLYRIGESVLSEEDLGMFEETMAEFPGPVLIEWAEFGHSWLPLATPLLQLEFSSGGGRRITLETFAAEDAVLHEVVKV